MQPRYFGIQASHNYLCMGTENFDRRILFLHRAAAESGLAVSLACHKNKKILNIIDPFLGWLQVVHLE
jgi:hypothetical protein